ncbi:MAG: nuclear transport factor 2 family protein [Abitibacteriaceae bacterium]|nr:nuclear transport factor 2 family protein [Abditibacteriaceae bacterium]MBV9867097.1 nuclear transport factor 2 family protein [Abditibacteriaceae bacterium]
MMLTKAWAMDFARDWIESWNAHDLDRILAHYTDHFEMTSPYIVKFAGEAAGTLRGQDAVGAYWKTALERIPDLHFELIEVFVSVNSLTILYKAALGRTATEVFFFNEQGRVYKAVAHYDAE